MIFAKTIDLVLSGRKTQTLRLAYVDDFLALAANQIAVTKRAIIVYADQINERVMLNPRIVAGRDLADGIEACLSYPGVSMKISRLSHITVAWQDESLTAHEDHFHDFEARVIQHEIDHLDGICKVGDAWRESKKRKHEMAGVVLASLAAAIAPIGGGR